MTPVEKVLDRADAISVLGLRGSETFDEIRRAWKRKAIETHPDHAGGRTDAFLKVKAAFELLSADHNACCVDDGGDARVYPRRPGQMDRSTSTLHTMSPKEQAACYELLASRPDAGATDHVAELIHSQGRNLVYIVASEAVTGLNRVALPAEILVTNREVPPKIVSLEISRSTGNEVVVPEASRREIFPGARSVRVRFGADMRRH